MSIKTAPVYEVEWTEAAAEDLLVKVDSRSVAQELVDIAKEALDLPLKEEEVALKYTGRLGRLLWRWGLTEKQGEVFAAADDLGEYSDAPGEQPWDYLLVYRSLGNLRNGYWVISVLKNSEVAAGIGEVPSLDNVQFCG